MDPATETEVSICIQIPWKRSPVIQGRKNSININFLARISRGHSWPLRPNAQGSKSFSPPPGPQENALLGADVHDFRRGRPWPEGLLKNFVQKKFALIFWPLVMCKNLMPSSFVKWQSPPKSVKKTQKVWQPPAATGHSGWWRVSFN